jgi:hypothetical protein
MNSQRDAGSRFLGGAIGIIVFLLAMGASRALIGGVSGGGDGLPSEIQQALRHHSPAERAHVRRVFREVRQTLAAEGDFGTDRSAAYDKGVRLARAGLWRLDDAQTLRRLEVLQRILRASSAADCAAIANGTPAAAAALYRAFSRLTGEEIATWFRITTAASVAELRGEAAARVLTDEEALPAFWTVIEQLSPSAQQTLALIDEGGTPEDATRCAVEIDLYTAILSLPISDAADLTRWLLRSS